MPKHQVDRAGLPIDPLLRQLEDVLTELGYKYRLAKTVDDRAQTAHEYREVLRRLIKLGWGDSLDGQSELPPRELPEEYFVLLEEMYGEDRRPKMP